MILEWVWAFAFTQVVEMGVYVQAPDRPLRERLWIAFAASAITHPIVWFVFPVAFSGHDYWLMVAFAESFAVLVEAVHLWIFGVRYALAWSLLANGTSFLGGLVCYTRLGF